LLQWTDNPLWHRQRPSTRLTVYPIKSLDGHSVAQVELVTNGGLAGDREYALFDSGSDYVNGKRETQVHPLSASYDTESASVESVTLSAPETASHTFGLSSKVDTAGPTALTDWLTDYFGYTVTLQRNREGGFPDDTEASGPTIISTATIETVASWFDGISPNEMRRRLRANIEIGGVDAFWEDRLFADRSHQVEFTIGDVSVFGVNPCQRCVVPTRDPDTGAVYDGFQETFIKQRRATMPEWSGGDWFDHDFRLMVNTDVPESSWGKRIAVGDTVEIGEPVKITETASN